MYDESENILPNKVSLFNVYTRNTCMKMYYKYGNKVRYIFMNYPNQKCFWAANIHKLNIIGMKF